MYEDISYKSADAFKTDLLKTLTSNKIEAIKMLRVATGGGLKACKDFVEALEDGIETACPCCAGSGRVSMLKARDILARMPR